MFQEQLGMIEAHWKSELPFVSYRKPNTKKVISVFQNDSRLHQLQDFRETGFVFAPYDKKAPGVLILPDKVISHEYQTRDLEYETSNIPETSVEGKTYHIEIVEEGVKSIRNTQLEKVVLSRRIVVPNNTSPLEIFQKVLDTYLDAFCYIWYHPKIGLWIGATPELLLHKQNSSLVAVSLAGTIKNIGTDNPLWGKKELEEQDMVTRHVAQQLRSYVSDLSIGKVNSVRAGNLWHLKTKIWGSIRDLELEKIINALHPTPAICGLPVSEAETFINKYENYDREFYTGYLGELNMGKDKNTDLFVNLRCMQIKANSALLYVGGGITSGSNAEQEWMETVHKSETMLNMIFN